MSRSVHVPAGLFDSRPYGFAQVTIVSTPAGRAVHVSGQVVWDADRNIVGAGDIGRQLEKSLENLAVALESVGATLDQVGALRLYIKQGHMHERAAISGALKAIFGDTRRVRRGSACQALPTMNSSSRWRLRRSSSCKLPISAACAGRARWPVRCWALRVRWRPAAPGRNGGSPCANHRSGGHRGCSPSIVHWAGSPGR